MNGFYGGKEASELLKVHQRTLYLWDKKGLIEVKRSPGGKRFYNVKKYLDERTINKVNYIEDIVEDIIEEHLDDVPINETVSSSFNCLQGLLAFLRH